MEQVYRELQAPNIMLRKLVGGGVRKPALSFKIMRVIVFFSGNATALRWILNNSRSLNKSYRIVGAFTDRKGALGKDLANEAGIPWKCLDYYNWCWAHQKKLNDLRARKEYFSKVSQLIKPFKAHVILCSGFMLTITEPLLSEYKYRILNVHPADLTIVDEKGKRKYTGKDAVAKAIADGQEEICSSIHIVTKEVDGGLVIKTSSPLPIKKGDDPLEIQNELKYGDEGYISDWTLGWLARAKIKLWDVLALR